MPVSTHLAPEAERTSPSLSGVSTPEESAKAKPTTTTRNPIEINAFFNFWLSANKLRSEKITVAAIEITRIICAIEIKW